MWKDPKHWSWGTVRAAAGIPMHFYPYLLQTKFIQCIIGDTDSKNTQDIEKSN